MRKVCSGGGEGAAGEKAERAQVFECVEGAAKAKGEVWGGSSKAIACIERANLLVGEVTSFSLVHLLLRLARSSGRSQGCCSGVMGAAAWSDRVRQVYDDGMRSLASQTKWRYRCS